MANLTQDPFRNRGLSRPPMAPVSIPVVEPTPPSAPPPPRRSLLRRAGGFFVVAGLGWWGYPTLRQLWSGPDSSKTANSPRPTVSTPVMAGATPAEVNALEQLAAVNPQSAILRTNELSAVDPEQAREFSYRLITGLQKAGAYVMAADYALTSAPKLRRDLIIAAFHEWGRNQPDQACAAAIRVQDPEARQTAFQSVLSGWSRTDPEGMAEAALAFPEGEEKKAALTKALRAWMHKDPEIAGDWILAHEAAIPVADEFFRKDQR